MQTTALNIETDPLFTSQTRSNTRVRIPRSRYTSNKDKIHYRRAQYMTLDSISLEQNRIISNLETSPFSEAYQLLRIQVLRRLKENNWNTLAVTSPRAGEGKTLTAINLAISMSREIGYSVILVDLNLSQPRLLKKFGLVDHMGLSHFLTDDIPVEDMLIQFSLYEDLVILPGGKPLDNPTEMLSSPKMTQLVSDLKACHKNCIIIFDMPPVLASAEALSFAPLTESVLLVIEEGVTKKQDLEQSLERLSCTNIVGTILNKT